MGVASKDGMGFSDFSFTLDILASLSRGSGLGMPTDVPATLGGKLAGPGATFSKSAQKKPPKSPWVGSMRMQWLNASRTCQNMPGLRGRLCLY